jgi:hypothetical protein
VGVLADVDCHRPVLKGVLQSVVEQDRRHLADAVAVERGDHRSGRWLANGPDPAPPDLSQDRFAVQPRQQDVEDDRVRRKVLSSRQGGRTVEDRPHDQHRCSGSIWSTGRSSDRYRPEGRGCRIS